MRPHHRLPPREEAVRRPAGAPGPQPRPRPPRGGPRAERVHRVRHGGRHQPAGRAVRHAAGGAGEDSRLLAGHREEPGGGQAAAEGGRDPRRLLVRLHEPRASPGRSGWASTSSTSGGRSALNATHRVLETGPYFTALRSGDYEASVDFSCDFADEPDLQLTKYLSSDKSPINYSRYTDATLDELYERQSREQNVDRRKQLVWEFERRELGEMAHQVDHPRPGAGGGPLGLREGLEGHALPLPQPGPRHGLARTLAAAGCRRTRCGSPDGGVGDAARAGERAPSAGR